jgi:hypothetical protein
MIGGGMRAKDVSRWRHAGCCVECGNTTDWTCPECAMYAGSKVWLCPVRACRTSHVCATTNTPIIAKAAN